MRSCYHQPWLCLERQLTVLGQSDPQTPAVAAAAAAAVVAAAVQVSSARRDLSLPCHLLGTAD